jgi:hypothetical protein
LIAAVSVFRNLLFATFLSVIGFISWLATGELSEMSRPATASAPSIAVTEVAAEPVVHSQPAAKKTSSCSTCPASGGKVEPGASAGIFSRPEEDRWFRVIGRHRNEPMALGSADGSSTIATIGCSGRLTMLSTAADGKFSQHSSTWSAQDGQIGIDKAGSIESNSLAWITADMDSWQKQHYPLKLQVGDRLGSHRIITADARHVVAAGPGNHDIDEIELTLDGDGRLIRWQHAIGRIHADFMTAQRVIVWVDAPEINRHD